MTLVEVTVSIALVAAVLGGATALLDASEDLAQSANDQGLAINRLDHALQPLAEALRRGSLASARKLDGSTFSSGDSDSGFQIRAVRGFSGTALTTGLLTFRLDRGPGAPEGELVRVDGAIETVLARGVTDFLVSRQGNLFTLRAATRAGPPDDRRRVANASVQVVARNP